MATKFSRGLFRLTTTLPGHFCHAMYPSDARNLGADRRRVVDFLRVLIFTLSFNEFQLCLQTDHPGAVVIGSKFLYTLL